MSVDLSDSENVMSILESSLNDLEKNDLEKNIDESATSVIKPEEMLEMKKMEKIPDQVYEKFYHVVLDCDFGDFVDDTKRSNRPAIIYGKIAKHINERIPVVYDKQDAIRIATKLINMVVARGCVGSGNDKKYPYLGAIVIGFQFAKDKYETVSYEKINVESSTGRLYDHSANHTKDLVFWEVNGVRRATIAKKALVNTKIVDGEYVARTDISPENGFALLNLVPSLSVDDITTLMCMYRGEGRNCYGHGSAKESEKVSSKVSIVLKGEVQLGGKYNDYASLYVREKAKYLLNNKKQSGGKINKYGDNDNDNDNDNAKEYMRLKKEYLKLKNQKGGKLNNDDNDDNDDNNDNYKKLYKQKKSEYFALKNKK